MILIFGICIALGSIGDIVISTLNYSNLTFLASGLLLTAINLAGRKKTVIKSILSLLVIVAALFALNFISSDMETIEGGLTGIKSESLRIEEEEGFESSLKFLQGTLRERPEDMALRQIYAEALFRNRDYRGVLREGQYMMSHDPTYSGSYVLLGDAYGGLNDNLREIYYYKIAVGLDETSIANRLKLAEAYGNSNLNEEAVEQFEIAKELATGFDEKNLVYESYLRYADAISTGNGQEVE